MKEFAFGNYASVNFSRPSPKRPRKLFFFSYLPIQNANCSHFGNGSAERPATRDYLKTPFYPSWNYPGTFHESGKGLLLCDPGHKGKTGLPEDVREAPFLYAVQ
jgi:hypothetical protein